MSKIVLYPWKRTSEGALLLAKTMGIEFITRDSRVNADTVVINWGSGDLPEITRKVVNKGSAICNAVNKKRTIAMLKAAHVPTLESTVNYDTATGWVEQGFTVYARTELNGYDGFGIIIYKTRQDLPLVYAPLYTKGFATQREFRVNCTFGETIDICEKKRRNGTNPNPDVRAGDDWVYCRKNLKPFPTGLGETAARAVSAIGLDFGGVDIASNAEGNLCVFEVNSAPWLGTVIAARYADAFHRRFQIEDL